MASRDWLKVEGYDDILDSLTLSQPKDSQEYIAVRISEGEPVSETEDFPAVDLWLPVAQLPKLDGLRKVIRKGLVELGHPATAPLIDSLLPAIAWTPRRARGREKLAKLFSCFRESRVTQTLVLPYKVEDAGSAHQPVRLGDFCLKPFQAEQMIDAALAARSPLGISTEVLESRNSHWCIESSLPSLPFCDVEPLEKALEEAIRHAQPDGAPWIESRAATVIGWLFYQHYLSEYHECLYQRFLADFRDAQSIHVTLGGSYFPIHDVRGLQGCLFLDHFADARFNSSRGMIGGIQIIGGIHTKLAFQLAEFLRTFGDSQELLASLDSHPINDALLRTYSRVLVIAGELVQNEKPEMAFLMYCTALECLMVGGSGEPIARALARRLGAVTSLSSDIAYRQAVEEIEDLYGTRSKFVHNARPIEDGKLSKLKLLCRQAYLAAVSAVDGSLKDREDWISEWHKLLDYLASALVAGVPVDAKAACAAGISLSSNYR